MSDGYTLPEGVTLDGGVLWGTCGGALEYVGQRLEWRKRADGRMWPVVVLLFTDHDHWPGDEGELEPGVFYRLEMPLSDRLPDSTWTEGPSPVKAEKDGSE